MSLTTRQLSFHYQAGEPVLHDLSLDFTRGRVIGILGANGCGKSTLFMNLLGVLKPQQGQVLWNGEPLKYDKKACASCDNRFPWYFRIRISRFSIPIS